MRIKHTTTEVYRVCNYLPMAGSFKDIKRWYTYKYYSTKQSALNAIKRIKSNGKNLILDKELIYRIDWIPAPFSKEFVTVYDESEDK